MQEQHQLAIWNPERDCWETGVVDIFGHSDVFSETWPTSGMTRNGVAYALPTWAPPTTASASSSSPPDEMLRTPAAAEAEGGALSPERARVENRTLRLTGQILDMVAPEQMSDAWKAAPMPVLKTPTSQFAVNGGSQHPDKRRAGGHGPTLADEVEHLLPTPTAMDAHMSGGSTPSNVTLTDATVRTRMGTAPNARHEPTLQMLPTPRATRGGSSTETVGLLTGDPTPPPSTAGNPSWEDTPLPLPSSPTGASTVSPPASPNG